MICFLNWTHFHGEHKCGSLELSFRENIDEPSILFNYLLANCQSHAKAATIIVCVDQLNTFPPQRRLEMIK